MISNPEPKVSVIAPTFNRCSVVEQTITQLRALDYPDDRYEILIVDNSKDETPQMVQSMAAEAGAVVRLITDCHPFPATKRNQGAQLATGELLWFINDDVWFQPDALREHVATHGKYTDPVAVVGSCSQSTQMDWTPFVEFYQPFSYDAMDQYVDGPVPYQYFWSMNLTLPRETMLSRNLIFHEDWRHIGHEDVELGYRWTRAGFQTIYNPRAHGEHYHPHTVASACRLQETIGRGLRDLNRLIPGDPALLARYGVQHAGSPRSSRLRGFVRDLLINDRTVDSLVQWLDSRTQRSRAADWAYWKVMMRFTNRGWNRESDRVLNPTPLLVTDSP